MVFKTSVSMLTPVSFSEVDVGVDAPPYNGGGSDVYVASCSVVLMSGALLSGCVRSDLIADGVVSEGGRLKMVGGPCKVILECP